MIVGNSGWKKPLAFLRAKYARRMLLSKINGLHNKIKIDAPAHYKIMSKNEAVDVERAMFNTDYSF